MSSSGKYSRQLVIIIILLIGIWARAFFARELHPNSDEFVSMLASKSVQISGLPVLPSGLFYTHGLLFSIVNGIYVGILQFIGGAYLPETLQFPYRIPSLCFSALAIAFLYRLGRDWFSPFAGLIAAGLLAIAPEMILWGSLVRMYSLAILLIPLLVYASYKMVSAPRAMYRWQLLTLLLLIAAFMTHFLTILFMPPLVLCIGVWAWQQKKSKGYSWILDVKRLLLWGFVFAGIIVGASKSLLPASSGWATTDMEGSDLSVEAGVNLVSRHIDFGSDWNITREFLAEIVWKYPLNLMLFVIILGGVTIWLVRWIWPNLQEAKRDNYLSKILFLFIISIGPLFELTLLVTGYRRDPRYFVPFWPVVFLLVASIIEYLFLLKGKTLSNFFTKKQWATPVIALVIVALFSGLGISQIRKLLYFNPAAYEKAFGFIKEQWQPEDIILTPYSAAGGLYLGRVDYFAADIGANAALLNRGDNQPVDRYWGAPWIGTGKQLQDLLKQSGRVWFVVSESVYDNYFRGEWHFVEQQNMELAWKDDSALIYRSQGQGISLPDQPDHMVEANLSNLVRLHGYSGAVTGSAYRIFLFWSVLSPLPHNFTQFVHIRSENGKTIAQADFEPLKGQYPTTLWKKGETVVDVVDIPIPADLSPGRYQVLAGLYRWDTLERIPVVDDTSGENAVRFETITIQ